VATDWWVAGPALVVAAGSVASVSIALLQIRNDRERRRREERRRQAERISAWPGVNAQEQEVILLNRSDAPVYQAVASLVLIQGAGAQTGEELTELIEQTPQMAAYRAAMGLIPPGRWRVNVDGGWGGTHRRPGIEVAFTDAAGIHWVRRTSGSLEELKENAFDHFKLFRPLTLVSPESAEAIPGG
jgi:hypothetical protein